MKRIGSIIFLDILKNRILLAYAALLGVLCWSAFLLEDNTAKGLLTVLNVILFTVPLVAILFSTIYLYNSAEFIELLLSQPVKRRRIWLALFVSLSASLCLTFALSAGIPLLVYSPDAVGLMMFLVGLMITMVFAALAFLGTITTRDKAKGIGIAILVWLYFALLFDGIVLFLLFQFADYPIEQPMVALTALSPIDLARIEILLQLDQSAMMGYTGAIFKDSFGTLPGMVAAFGLLSLWILIPFYLSLHKFRKKDL